MSSSPLPALKKTALSARHHASGARMIDFGGWEMPVEYSGIADEHLAVRTRAGLFDVSHMGQIEVAGTDALKALQWMTCNDVAKLAIGQAQYSALTTHAGTFADDVLVYRMGDDHYMLVVNAANVTSDYGWIGKQAAEHGGDVAVVNSSARYALIALQGPAAEHVLQSLTAIDLADLQYYWFATGEVAGIRVTLSRTGYTGEDGFEIFVAPAQADRLWEALMAAGRDVDVRPCGLGARDTLRLEAGMRLCGSDMDAEVTVLEADLGWIVAWGKGRFLGSDRLVEQRARGVERRLVGFEVLDRAIARHGHVVIGPDGSGGVVTSGTYTPYLKKAIGFAMVSADLAAIGREFEIDIRGKRARAQVVRVPFYKRPKAKR